MDLLEAEGRLLRRRTLDTLLAAALMLAAVGLAGVGGGMLLGACFLWLDELVGRPLALTLVGVVCVVFGGLGAWTIRQRMQ